MVDETGILVIIQVARNLFVRPGSNMIDEEIRLTFLNCRKYKQSTIVVVSKIGHFLEIFQDLPFKFFGRDVIDQQIDLSLPFDNERQRPSPGMPGNQRKSIVGSFLQAVTAAVNPFFLSRGEILNKDFIDSQLMGSIGNLIAIRADFQLIENPFRFFPDVERGCGREGAFLFLSRIGIAVISPPFLYYLIV